MKKFTKEQAISIVVKCAEKYKTELENKKLLFVCSDKHKKVSYIEFSFYRNNYMHLTGLKPNNFNDNKIISANDFYQKCLDHKLSVSDFEFSKNGTTHMKLAVLPDIICKNLHANIIGDYNSPKPHLYTKKNSW